MKIRNAVEADLPEIVEIYNSTIACQMITGDMEPVTIESRRSWFQAHDPAHRPLWVLDTDGQVVAWLGLQSFYGRAAYEATVEISLYVHAEYRRCGLGRQLLQYAIAQSPNLGIKTLLGFIFAHNQPSLNLFEVMQFQRWGYLPKVADFHGTLRDLVIVGRSLK